MRQYGFACFILILFCVSSIAISDVDPSIVVYFTFDTGEGNTAVDISGNGNDGAINSAQWVSGKYGRALEFDGATSHVTIMPNATLDLADGMTLMAWIYKTEFVPANNGETIISKKQSGAYSLEVAGWENRFPDKFSSEPRISGTYHPIQSPDPAPLNQWVHVAVTYDGDSIRMYVDGEMVTEEKWPGKIDTNSATVYVGVETDGNQPDATHGRFKGIIDEVIVANRAFSADEIKIYMEGPTAVEPEAKLPVYWGVIKAEAHGIWPSAID
jgi:hypothetical protein